MFTFINQFFLELLTVLAQFFNGNLGFAIVALTILVRFALLPLTLPSLNSQKKITALKPELDKIKQKYSHDKKILSQKQLELYQKHQINPLAGCLPQIIQLVFLIILYQVLINSLNNSTIANVSLDFYWLTLNHPDNTLILPVVAGISQLVLGVMILPATSTKAEHQLAAKTSTKKDDQEAASMTDMATTMQSQMVLLMPAFTFFLALKFPSGLALYWVVTTLFSLVQQYFVSGLGGLKPYLDKVRSFHSTHQSQQ